MLWYFHSNVYSISRVETQEAPQRGGGGIDPESRHLFLEPRMSKTGFARRQFIFRNSKHPKTGL